MNEQRTLGQVGSLLDEELRETIPTPLGAYLWGELLVGVESCIEGRVLAHPRHLLARVATRIHVKHLRAVADWLCTFHRRTMLRRQPWDLPAVDRLESTFNRYEAAFGLTSQEGRLFAETHAAAVALQGHPIPIVWRHCDLNPKNTYQTAHGIGVVDWEDGTEGYPLLDLLFFCEEWLHHFPGTAPELAGKLSRFHVVFLEPHQNDLAGREIRRAIRRYMAGVGLTPAFYPVLHVFLWADSAVRWNQRTADFDYDEIARGLVSRYVGAVRGLARRGSRQRESKWWDSPAADFDA